MCCRIAYRLRWWRRCGATDCCADCTERSWLHAERESDRYYSKHFQHDQHYQHDRGCNHHVGVADNQFDSGADEYGCGACAFCRSCADTSTGSCTGTGTGTGTRTRTSSCTSASASARFTVWPERQCLHVDLR